MTKYLVPFVATGIDNAPDLIIENYSGGVEEVREHAHASLEADYGEHFQMFEPEILCNADGCKKLATHKVWFGEVGSNDFLHSCEEHLTYEAHDCDLIYCTVRELTQ